MRLPDKWGENKICPFGVDGVTIYSPALGLAHGESAVDILMVSQGCTQSLGGQQAGSHSSSDRWQERGIRVA